MKELTSKVDVYRRSRGMKQDELASLVGVRRETIVRLEKGQYNPSLKLALDLAEVFDVAVEDLFKYVEIPDD